MPGDFGPQRRIEAFDGLRGVAVSLVVVHHAELHGRFAVGTEIFFVLSGYLITKSLAKRQKGPAGGVLIDFYKRRTLRLLPPLLGLLAAALLIVPQVPSLDPGFRRGVAAALTYSMNWQLALRPGCSSTLIHLWSLAAEQQFYLLWPPLVLLLPRRWVTPLLALALLGAVMWRAQLYAHGASVERLYYALDTHADGLIVGCILGLTAWPARHAARLRLGGIPAFAALLALALVTPAALPFAPVLSTSLLAALSAVVVLAATIESPLATLLSTRPLRWIGIISYSLYLWHLPVLALVDPHWSHGRTAFRIAVAAGCAVIAYLLVERPVNKRLRIGRGASRPAVVTDQPADEAMAPDALVPQHA